MGWMISLARSPENARSSSHVEYASPSDAHSARIGSSIDQMSRFARAGLVGAPCGSRLSYVVSIVRIFEISGEQPKVDDHTR